MHIKSQLWWSTHLMKIILKNWISRLYQAIKAKVCFINKTQKITLTLKIAFSWSPSYSTRRAKWQMNPQLFKKRRRSAMSCLLRNLLILRSLFPKGKVNFSQKWSPFRKQVSTLMVLLIKIIYSGQMCYLGPSILMIILPTLSKKSFRLKLVNRRRLKII